MSGLAALVFLSGVTGMVALAIADLWRRLTGVTADRLTAQVAAGLVVVGIAGMLVFTLVAAVTGGIGEDDDA